MKSILIGLCYASLLAGVASYASVATVTMTGTISDSMCGAVGHAEMTNGKARSCTLVCVEAGAKYVFVSDGKVYQIANQNEPGLARGAGNRVSLTGEVNGKMITVSKLTMIMPFGARMRLD
jgi:hypothetical protein